MRHDLTVVFGVSGVGKTTVCAKLAKLHHEFRHITASQLISQPALSVGRSMDETQAAQAEIVERVCHLRESEPRRIILDGHCVIRLASGLYQLPSEFIVALAPTMLILIEAEPETIWKRRVKRDELAKARTVDEIGLELSMTRDTCFAYHHNLSIPLRVFKSDQSDLAEELFACLT
ncbi:ATP-binding protein [Neorhizobium galegae]|uniref:ATP-binding protein n=1 Tax=Neorhizobium galegae TaxID=399 RepID=UPI0021043294|nr:ATP-binding protein [Neorhizobium galegae]MCQ1855375.1 ATP-binding protein [Neorhizobium galegae]